MMGGTGKTPFIKWILSNVDKKFNVLISSRGYRSKWEKKGGLIYAGDTGEPDLIGDENIEVLGYLKSGAITVGKDRRNQISKALSQKSYELIILDDGFQHLRIERNLNIVLFNTLISDNDLRVFPAGYLREGLASLLEADLVILTNCDFKKASNGEKFLMKRVSPHLSKTTPVYRSEVILKKIYNIKSNEVINDHSSREFIVVCGVSNPEKVLELLRKSGVKFSDFVFFPDHHHYNKKSYQKIQKKINKYNLPIIITEKDVAKFDCSKVVGDVFCCEVDLGFFGKELELIKLVQGRV